MNRRYKATGRYSRYGVPRRKLGPNKTEWPMGVLAASAGMLLVTIVIAIVVLSKASQAAELAAAPTPTPMVITVDKSAEMTALMQQLIDQAAAGDISADTVDKLVAGGVSKDSIDKLAAVIQSEPASGAYKDGVYEGTGKGENGNIKAEVTIKDGRIFYIAVVAHSEKGAVTKDVFEPIAITVMENQSADGVDTISGATAISGGYIDAITEALGKAK